jgi:hypothetical protein
MKWSRRWVKVEVESPKLLTLSWQARGLYRLLKSHWNEEGRIDLGELGLPVVAVLLRTQWDEIAPFVTELLDHKMILRTNLLTICDPYFLESTQGDTESHKIAKNKKKNKKEEEEINTTEPRKRGRPGSPLHQATIDKFWTLWTELRGGTYDVQPKDGRAVSYFLRRHPDLSLEEIERRMRCAFADPWFLRAGDLTIFFSNWSKYDGLAGGKVVHLNRVSYST